MVSLPGYSIGAVISRNNHYVVYSGRRLTDDREVILKTREDEEATYANSETQREYSILDLLNGRGSIRPIELNTQGTTPVLVMEKFDGTSLAKKFDAEPMLLPQFLKFAIKTADILDRVHGKNLLHNDLNPANILLGTDDSDIRLINFGISAQNQLWSHDKDQDISSSLPYASPERTGRMGHEVDQRSDLYSLGAILYKALTGRPPFICTSSLRYVHAHLAQEADSPQVYEPNIPPVIAEIILKLLSKAPEDRYQTAEGLKHDLEACLESMKSTAEIEEFPLGVHDVPTTFLLPKTLYGRAVQTRELLDAFEDCLNGRLTMMFVTGESGVGKTAFASQIQTPLAKAGGRVIEGKAIELARHLPYMVMNQALNSLVDQLLLGSTAELEKLKEQMQDQIGKDLPTLLEIFPAIKRLIPDLSEPEQTNTQPTQSRLWSCIYSLLGIVATIENPLALFIDDLQWADAGTIGLLEYLISHSQSDKLQPALYILCTFKTGDTTNNDFELISSKMIGTDLARQIDLRPLEDRDISDLLCDLFHCQEDQIRDLSTVVSRKTGNNPFLVTNFLHYLYDIDLFRQDKNLRWHWSLKGIESAGIPDNAVSAMQEKIQHLEPRARELLTKASIVGNRFDITALNLLVDFTPEDLSNSLNKLINQGLVAPLRHHYRFVHEKIQESSYLMLAEEERAQCHSKIGKWMFANIEPEGSRLFVLTEHLNKGISELTDSEISNLIGLNLKSGDAAMASAAWVEALSYYEQGLLLAADSSEELADQKFRFEIGISRCFFLLGDKEAAMSRAEQLFANPLSNKHLVQVAILLIELNSFSSQFSKACDIGIYVLKQLGLEFDSDLSHSQIDDLIEDCLATLHEFGISSFRELPIREDDTWLQQLTIINAIITPAYFCNNNLSIAMTCYAVNQIIDLGLNEQVPIRLGGFGIILGLKGRNKLAYEIEQEAIHLSRLFGNKQLHNRLESSYLQLIPHWVRPVTESIEPLLKTSREALELGENRIALDGFHVAIGSQIVCGEKLEVIKRSIRDTHRLLAKELNTDNILSKELYKIMELYTSERKCEAFTDLVDPTQLFNQKLMNVPNIKEQIMCVLSQWYLANNRTKLSLELARKYARSLEQHIPGNIYAQLFQLVLGISAAREAAVAKDHQKDELINTTKSVIRRMNKWAAEGSDNWNYQIQWIEAELSLSRKFDDTAMMEMIRARERASSSGFIHHVAFITQRVLDLCVESGLNRQAGIELDNLTASLSEWGATWLSESLVEKYVDAVDKIHRPADNSTELSTPFTPATLDIDTIIDNSRAISEGVNIESVTRSFLSSAIENAGAQRGVLLLIEEQEITVQAESNITGEFKIINQPIKNYDDIAHSIIHFVVNKNEHVILNEASRDGLFTRDPWIIRNEARSILALPAHHRGELRAILFLSNELAGDVFTRDRIRILDLLSAQAAISLGQAKVYEELEQRVEYRTLELQLAITEAKKATDSKSNFLATMSHEIRTPMNGVLGMAQLMSMTQLSKEQKEYLDALRSSGESLLSILNDILDFSKLEAGKMLVDKDRFSLWECLREVGDLMAPAAQNKQVEFPIIIHPSVPEFISSDKTRLRQILLNLVNNAVKFTDSGYVCISASVDNSSGTTLQLDITDTGIGIEPQLAKNLFKPFTQADATTTRQFGGTGLGLSISKHLTNLLGGELNLNSIPGEGSQFSLSVPVVAEVNRRTGFPELQHKRIHICTELKENRSMLRCLIEQIGGSVSDSESLPTSDLNSYDILFVEPEHLTVPGVDLRSTSARIIVVSTWPQRTDVEKKAFAMNAELITRPVSMHSLIELFDRRTTEAEEEAVEFDRKDLKILIVEDNLVNQKIASAMLSKAGLTCDIAKDGIEALEKHSQDSWDIIFMDCHMPRMDGFKASEEIRRREKNSGRHDTIIALTANVLQGDKDRCLEAGMDAYLPKPLDRAELYQVIKNHIGEDQAIDHK